MAPRAFNLVLRIFSDTKGALKARKALRETSAEAKRASKSMSGATATLRGFRTAFAGLGIGLAARELLRVGSEFQNLRVQLETVTGSAERASAAFNEIKEFASATPFQVANITKAFTNLSAKGFEPTTENLRALGDMAAAFGTDITQATQAVTSAAFGEAEMLKQYGIIMRQQGESVKLTYKGVTQEIKKDSNEIFQALTKLASENFFGGMERSSRTLSGRISTLKDQFKDLLDSLAQTGILDSVTTAVEGMSAALSVLQKHWDDLRIMVLIALKGITQGVTVGFGSQMKVIALLMTGLADLAKLWSKMPGVADNLGEGMESAAAKMMAFADSVFHTGTLLSEGLQIKIDETFDSVTGLTPALQEGAMKLEDLGAAGAEANAEILELQSSVASLRLELEAAQQWWTEFWEAPENIDLPNTIDVPFEFDWDEFSRVFGDEIEETMRDAPPWDEFRKEAENALTRAIYDALLSGDVKGALKLFAQELGSMVAASLSQKLSGAISGAFAKLGSAAFFGKALGIAVVAATFIKIFDAFGSRLDMTFQRYATLDINTGAIERLSNVIGDLSGVVKEFQAGVALITGATGGTFGISPIDVTKNRTVNEGQFQATFQNLPATTGLAAYADTAEEAINGLIQVMLEKLNTALLVGAVDVANMHEEFVKVLKNSGATSFAELARDLQTAADLLRASMDSVAATVFETMMGLASQAAEGLRLGMSGDVVQTAVNAGIQAMLAGIAGVSVQAFADMDAVMAQVREGLKALNMFGAEAAIVLRDAAVAVRLYNREIRANALGQMAAWAKELGVSIRIQRKAAILEAKVRAKKLEIELKMLGMWEKWGHLVEQMRDMAIEAAKTIGAVTNAVKQSAGTVTAAANTIKAASNAFDSTFSDFKIKGGGGGKKKAKREEFRRLVEGLSGTGKSQTQTAFDALIENYVEAMDWVKKNKPKVKGAMDELRAAFEQGWANLVEGLKMGLQEFRDSLDFSQYAEGTPRDLPETSRRDFLMLLNRARRGDVDALAQLQASGSRALEFGSAAFGTSTEEFRRLFDMITGGLDEALGADFKAPLDAQTQAIVDQTAVTVRAVDRVRETIAIESIRDRVILSDIRDAVSTTRFSPVF